MKKLLILTAFLSISVAMFSQGVTYFDNPVNRGDFADPTIIKVGDTFYVTATSSEWAPHFPLFTSTDLINWEQVGHILNEKPQWTSHSFWAPELYYMNNKMFCYYTARRKSDNVSYIGVATSGGTSLDFEDHGPIIEYGTEAIDPFVYNDNGNLYITWKAYGLDNRPIELLGSRLSEDGLKLEGEIFSLLKDEGIGLEGQYHFKHGEFYYIIYSAKSCCGPGSDYDVRVARSTSFFGPYEKYSDNPILYGDGTDYISCGHGTVVETDDGRLFYYSHGYQSGDNFFLGRQHILHELQITEDGWLKFKTGRVAVNRHQVPFGGTIQKGVSDFRDDFNSKELNVSWTWNFPYSDINTEIKNGSLILSGNMTEGNENGTALCLRPQTIRYNYITKVSNVNDSFKGLTMYGDDKNMVAIGIKNNNIEVRSVSDGKSSTHYSKSIDIAEPHLKIEVERGRLLRFYYSLNGENWITATDSVFDASHLVRWDRVARPGLIHIGDGNNPAEYDYFELNNL